MGQKLLKRFALALTLLFFAVQTAGAAPHLFILADTIKQPIYFSKALAVPGFVYTLGYTTGATFGTYHLTHGNVTATVLMGLYQYGTGVLEVAGEFGANLKIRGIWNDKKLLEPVAGIPGVDKIHIFTSGHADYLGILPYKINAQSIVIAETERSDLPDVMGSHWIEIPDRDTAKIRMNLLVQGQPATEPVEISIKEFLTGTELAPETKAAWIKAIKSWEGKIPLWKGKIFAKKFAQEVSIKGTLILSDQNEKSLGNLASGEGAKNLLGLGLINAVKRTVKRFYRRVFKKPDNSSLLHFTREVEVIPEQNADNTCLFKFKKIFGKLMI